MFHWRRADSFRYIQRTSKMYIKHIVIGLPIKEKQSGLAPEAATQKKDLPELNKQNENFVLELCRK